MTSIEDDRNVLESDRANDCQGQEKSSSHSTSPWKVYALRFTNRPGLSHKRKLDFSRQTLTRLVWQEMACIVSGVPPSTSFSGTIALGIG
jgi:hypothetical protein